DDWDDGCRLFCCSDCASDREDDVDFAPDELGSDLGIALAPSFCPAVLDRDGAPLVPAKFIQSLHERGDPTAPVGRSARTQDAYSRQLARLLCACHERPSGRRAAE